VMRAATHGRESATATAGILPAPADTEQVTICALSGMRANPWCPSRAKEWVAVGDPGAPPCSWHHQGDGGLLTIYPPEYRAWAGSDRSAPVRPAVAARSPSPAPAVGLTISSPPAGAIYSVDPTLRREFQALPLRVVTPRPTTVTWMVDGETMGTISSERALSWPLTIGAHEIEARDADGRRARASVIVK